MKRHMTFASLLLISTVIPEIVSANIISNFSELKSAISNGGEYQLSSDISVTENLAELSGTLNIDGKGFVLKGNNNKGFRIKENAQLVLKNIGNSENQQGMEDFDYNISNAGNTTLSNIIFNNNKIESNVAVRGGIIRNSGILGIENSFFTGNIYSTTSGSLWGGIIGNGVNNNGAELRGSDFTIEYIRNTQFNDNIFSTVSPSTAAPHAGVILNLAHIKEINHVSFENNIMQSSENSSGGAHGTAIDNQDGGRIDLITDSVFLNNKIVRTGATQSNGHASAAAIDNYNYIGKISHSVFDGNGVETERNYAGAGAIMVVIDPGTRYDSEGKIDYIESCIFKNNYSKNTRQGDATGGAISHGGYTITLNNSFFEGNYASAVKGDAFGGAIDFLGSINQMDKLTFRNNYATSEFHLASGGAIFSNGFIDVLSNSLFEGNHVNSKAYSSQGGAISLQYAINSLINLQFKRNYASSIDDQVQGGALAVFGNSGELGELKNSLFEENYSYSENAIAGAGAITIHSGSQTKVVGKINNVIFNNNYAQSKNSMAFGGAIYNGDTIKEISSSQFNGNYVFSENDLVQGGAIRNVYQINLIKDTVFKNNYAKVNKVQAIGGALFNGAQIDNMTNILFENNYAYGVEGSVVGGAVANAGDVALIDNVDFIGNYGISDKDNVRGGALFNVAHIAEIKNSDFIGNYLKSPDYAQGGAIYNSGDIDKIVNSDFMNNYVEGKVDAKGGAIYSRKNLNIIADNDISQFEGNYVIQDGVKTENAVYMVDSTLKLSALNKGQFVFDDEIDGSNYNIDLESDGSGQFIFNNKINNVKDFVTADNSFIHLGVNSLISTQNMSVKAPSTTTAVLTPTLKFDVEVDKANNTVNSGVIKVSNDVKGNYKVIVNALNSDVLENKSDAVVKILEAPNDDNTTDSNFEIARIIGSPYLWEGKINNNPTSGTDWYLNLSDVLNPDYNHRLVAPEVIAYIGLPSAAYEQVRGLKNQLSNKIASSKYLGCRYDDKLQNSLWVDSRYLNSSTDNLSEYDAKVWNITAGGDVQSDLNNQLGLFVSYGNGNFDFSGKNEFYYAQKGSEIDIDSYMGGLYYRYDKNKWYGLATLFGGTQEADIKAKDGLAQADTDITILGAGFEGGKRFMLSNSLALEPNMSVYYIGTDIDDLKDNVGKQIKYDSLQMVEAEAGLKLAYNVCQNGHTSNVYIKPSFVQTFGDGEPLKINGLIRESEVYDDQTLGRLELGAKFGIADNFSAYAWGNYSFGSDYDATALGLGLNYHW